MAPQKSKSRDYRKEYDKYQKHRTKYRSELNGERRRRGIYGKGGGDVTHRDNDGDGKLEPGEFGPTKSAKDNRGVDRVRDQKRGMTYQAKRKKARAKYLRGK